MKRNYYIFSTGILKRKNFTLQFIPNKETEDFIDDNQFEEIILRTKLSPLVSFLHEPSDNRLSLIFDIAEIFKPLLGDRLIFKMLNQNSISINDFEYRDGGCYLNESGRKKFVEAYDKRLEKTIMHRQLKRPVSYKRLIRLECYKIIKHIKKEEDYKPFIIWW
jgi:CRISPR-associated protein Cas1